VTDKKKDNEFTKSNADNRALARAIIKEFFTMIDVKLGKCIRQKLVYIFIALIVVGAISVGIIKIPGGS